jgi:alpha-galactosidase
MNTCFGSYTFGDTLVRYLRNEDGQVGLDITPLSLQKQLTEKKCVLSPLAHIALRGDPQSSWTAGHSMLFAPAVGRFRFSSQTKEAAPAGTAIKTVLKSPDGLVLTHTLFHPDGCRAFETGTSLQNTSDKTVCLEMLTSFSLGGLTPYAPDDAANALVIHRVRSAWSSEGRLSSQTAEELELESAWAPAWPRTLRFGETGSMPVKGFFPFCAVEDTQAGVTWAAQLCCPSSWQMELWRQDSGLCVSGGLADYEFGHWCKNIAPGETFNAPTARLTAAAGGVDEASQRLLDIAELHHSRIDKWGEKLPVFYNEYCTTWGDPDSASVSAEVSALKGKDVDYFVIDAGWFGKKGAQWSTCGGEWKIDPGRFPDMRRTVGEINSAGMTAGIWFEAETCLENSGIFRSGLVMRRDGHPLQSGGRRFLDMSMPGCQAYLDERVIGLLRDNSFGYVKIDYNENAGIGCDGCESPGEGLRRSLMGTQEFFRRMRRRIPGLVIENCASGGHRLEPSMMDLCDIASFSDAHECREIPIIARNLHRMILPCQSQIWAVLRSSDDDRRLAYSLTAACYGVLCLSGDITSLSRHQWDIVEEGIAFYREASPVIRHGASEFFGSGTPSCRHPQGWQATVRKGTRCGRTLVLVHAFSSPLPENISLAVSASSVSRVFGCAPERVSLEGGRLTVRHLSEFEGIGILLE